MKQVDVLAKRATTPKHCSGIALMEVLVSVSILGIGFATLLWSLSHCARFQSSLDEREMGRFLAERQLRVLRSEPSSKGETTGDFAAPYEAYAWSARREPAADQSPVDVIGLSISKRTASGVRPVYSLRTILHAGA